MKIKTIQRKNSGVTVDQSPKNWLVNFGLALSLSFTTGVHADDTDILFPSITYPANIFFLIDLSGSMNNETDSGLTRIQSMQEAVSIWLPTARDVEVGLFKYSGNSENLGMVNEIVPVEANSADLASRMNALTATGGTPTVDALWYANQYFSGELVDDFRDGTGRTFASPVVNECQQNHVVVLTDGHPNGDDDVKDEIEAALYPNGGGCPDVGVQDAESNGSCGAELTEYMKQGPDAITTHTIGFHINGGPGSAGGYLTTTEWLTGLSAAGGGMHFSVNTTDALSDAFNQILTGISTSFAAPTVSLNSYNESRHSDELYYSQFQPYSYVRWDGNVKKYRINDEGVVVDSRGSNNEGLPLLINGSIDTASRSFWSLDAADGDAIKSGGFAANLPPYEQRQWYTDYQVAPGNDGMITPWKIQSDNNTDVWMRWAQGADVEDSNADGDVSDNHFYVADALHNSPVLLSYSVSADGGSQSEVVFSSTNMGMLHAIDAETGVELWAYSPEEHLTTTHQSYFDNVAGMDHVYGLDGNFAIHSTNNPNPSSNNSFEVETAWLYMTERRGGNRVYALDVSRGDQQSSPFKVMWKITGGDVGAPYDIDTDNNAVPDRNAFADLAQTWSKPQMITVQYGCDTQCESRDLLMFGGGYNAAVYDDESFEYAGFTPPSSGHGNAVYLVDPETGKLVWSVGNGNHHSLDLPMNHSVPATPVSVDTDFDGHVDMLFFSDIAGNVWRVDLDQVGAASESELHLSGGQIAALAPVGENLRFFTALDMSRSGGSVGTGYFNIVLGSGMRSSPLLTEPDVNKLFAFKDRWMLSAPEIDDNTQLPDYRYVETTNGGDNTMLTASDLRNLNDTNSSVTTDYGYYLPLEPGEKVLEPTVIHRDSIFLATYMPPSQESQNVDCASPLGVTRLYIRNLLDGENLLSENLDDGDTYFNIGVGIVASPQLIDTGGEDGPLLLAGEQAFPIDELLGDGASPVVFRKMNRTGWVERDGYEFEDVEKEYAE